MFSKILITLCSLIGVIGTIYAVLSILNMKFEDIYKSITLGGIEERDEELLTQREQAQIGILLVVTSWIGQTAFSFLTVKCLSMFLIACLLICMCIFAEILAIHKMNKNFKIKYKELKENGNKKQP